LRRKKKAEGKKKEGKRRKEKRKGAVRELKEEGEVGWAAREVGGERVDRIGLLSILFFSF
jgi:IS5 family transposase